MDPRIGVIIGSTRPKRICPEIAEWVRRTAQAESSLVFETIDLREINLPFLDEPEIAARGIYAHEHTKRWSALVSSYSGFVLVFPQYNWGYPGALKNALDFLYEEWSDKPVGLVTYGTKGGGRAAEQMKIVAQGFHMRNTATNPALNTNLEQLDAGGTFIDIASAFAEFAAAVHAMAAELEQLLTKSAT